MFDSPTGSDQQSRPAHKASAEERSSSGERRLLWWLAAGAIALLISSVTAFLWYDRQQALKDRAEHASRQVMRLSHDLEQTLKIAGTAISRFDRRLQATSSDSARALPTASAESSARLLASLTLPFELHALAPEGHRVPLIGLDNLATRTRKDVHNAGAPLPPGVWTLSDAPLPPNRQIIPLTWAVTPNQQGITGYRVDLSLAAAQAWLDSDRLRPLDRVSLFWLNGDGSATLLARSPYVAEESGRRVTADWVTAAMREPEGVVDLESQLDQRNRRVAYRRLEGAASALVLVYGSDTHSTLASWRAQLPFFIGLALVLAAAMAYGGWRLDRSLRALTLSEKRFQLMLNSGQVWDWDIAGKTMRYAPDFLVNLGYEAVSGPQMMDALFAHMEPSDAERLRTALNRHIRTGERYAETYRIRNAQGHVHTFETQGQAFWDADGKARYMAGTSFEITARRALEEAQRQTLQRLDTVANASPVLYWTSGLDGEVDWVNQRWLEFTGQTLEQALGQGWAKGVHPEDAPRRRTDFEAARRSLEPFSSEYRLLHNDGTYHWVVAQGLPMRDADQRAVGFIGSCVDVSELKLAEEDARQRGAMVEGMFDVLQDLLFVIDSDGRFVHFRGATDAKLYLPPEVFLGKTIREVMPPDIAELLHRELALATPGHLREFTYVLSLPEGKHNFDARLALLPDSDHILVVARDITEREALRHQQERLRQFMTLQARLATNFINHPLDTIDTEVQRALGEIGAFVGADRAYIFRYDLEKNVARNTHEWCAEGIDSVQHDVQALPIEEMLEWEWHRAGKPYAVNDTLTLEAGPTRVMLLAQGIQSMTTLPMSTGETCLGFVGFDSVRTKRNYGDEELDLLQLFAQMLLHVTERRATDARLRELTMELEQRVHERTEQLNVSVRRLSQANRELESFAYSVSHDLKAPLRSVEGFASLLLEEHSTELGEEGRNYLTRIQRATLHMARLISDLLSYCRMEDMDKLIQPVQLLDIVTQVIEGMRNELDALDVEVEVNIPANLTALAHPKGLAMVLRNLIDNALKFTRPGVPPVVRLSARATGPVTHLCVKDEGQGFDMKYHDRIFAIFQRLHRPDEVAGTGIGLAMVFKAIQRMNGRIWADSEPGKGAEFHIELPNE